MQYEELLSITKDYNGVTLSKLGMRTHVVAVPNADDTKLIVQRLKQACCDHAVAKSQYHAGHFITVTTD